MQALVGCKVRSAGSNVASASAYGRAASPETEYQLAEWKGGREGEIACACDGGTLVRYHATNDGIARVVVSQNEDLESCVVARLKAKDTEKGEGQCRYAF